MNIYYISLRNPKPVSKAAARMVFSSVYGIDPEECHEFKLHYLVGPIPHEGENAPTLKQAYVPNPTHV